MIYDYFVTINAADWKNSPYAPKSNGKILTDRNGDGDITDCWYIDSRLGRWTTLCDSLEHIKKGETAMLAFWVKFGNLRGKTTFMADIFQETWEKRTTFSLLENVFYIAGRIGDCYLFAVPYTAGANNDLVFTVSMNNMELFIYPASEKDLKRSDINEPISEEVLLKENYRIVNCYKQDFPKTRFIGIRYFDEDRVDGMFGWYWGQWFESGKFGVLEEKLTEEFKAAYPDAGAYIGLMRYKEGEPLEYWIGMFLPEGSDVPEGYSYADFVFSNAGICWIKGQEEFVYCHEDECYEKLLENGMQVLEDEKGACWFFELYGCPRFTAPDENNEIILDIGYFVEG